MTQRVLLMALVAGLFFTTTSFAQEKNQEKKNSPASASDIPVDQIKKATAKPETKQDSAASKAADSKQDAAKQESTNNDSPKPVAEGTPVDQPDCKSDDCNSCDPCRKRCRGGLFSRLRSMLGRRCCG